MSGPRYNDFRPMTARRDSVGCVNGPNHEIKAGDRIGWSRRHRLACCAACWAQWSAENSAADEYEARYASGDGHYDHGGYYGMSD